jgi:serine/threonine protein kinase
MDISAMGFTDEVSSLQPGMTLGNLHIVSFVGKGAIGEVYRAQHDILGKEFAVKVIPRGFGSDQSGNDAFKQAARIQAKLDHPNILRIDDLGDEDLFYWLRMEYVEGEPTSKDTRIRTLADLMDYTAGPLPEDEVRYYLYHALLGLDFAHQQGIVHSDLKPANIMLGAEGSKIAELGVVDMIGHAWDDFHLLKKDPLMEPTPFDPLPGFSRLLPALLDTYEHYSPEQKAGQRPNAASNLYTMGVIAYCMLSGRNAITLDTPTEAAPSIDPGWDGWIKRAIAFNPEQRFSSAREMLESLPGLESGE